MAFSRPDTDSEKVSAIPALFAEVTFTVPIDIYVRERGGVEHCIKDCKKKKMVDLGIVEGTYRNNFTIENLGPNDQCFVRFNTLTTTVYGTDIISPDIVRGVAPRPRFKVQTAWEYTDDSGGVFHSPMNRWLSDGNSPARAI